MTHLEIYLETLRDLPLVASRQAAWLHTLDTKMNALQRECDTQQEEILALCKSGSSPTPEQLQKLRAKQWEAYAMSQEKIAMADEWSKILESYSIRLSEEMEAYEAELPPELLKQAQASDGGKKPTASDIKKKITKVAEKEIELLPATTSGTAMATLGGLATVPTSVTPPPTSSTNSSASSSASGAVSALAGTNKIRIRPGLFKLSSQGSSSNLKASATKSSSTKQRLEDEALGLTHDISGPEESETTDFAITSSAAAGPIVPDQAVYSTEEDYPPATKVSHPPVFKHKNPDGSSGVGVPPSDELFCTCRQPSYGEMIGCDDPKCRVEWFHFACVGLTQKPKSGSWYCDECKARNAKT